MIPSSLFYFKSIVVRPNDKNWVMAQIVLDTTVADVL